MTMLFFYLSIALFISFLCSILEAVLLSSSGSFIELKAKESKGGEVLKKVKSEIDISLSAILTLNTFAHTIGAAGVGSEAAKIFGESYMVAISIVLTILILFLSEILPKTLGAIYWKNLAVPAAYVITFISSITYPIVFISRHFTGIFGGSHEQEVSREEIIVMSEIGEKSGKLREKEVDYIENLLSLRDYKVRDILTPRTVIVALEKNVTVDEAIGDKDISHSRIPVFDETIDNIIGVVFSSSILEAKISGKASTTMQEIMKPVFKVSENLPVDKTLDLFIKRKEHMFIAVDKYDQTEGLVTLEDAMETLLGVEIMDELDDVEDMQEFARMQSRQSKK